MKRSLVAVTFALMALMANTGQAFPVQRGREWHHGEPGVRSHIIVGVDPWWGVPPLYWDYPPPVYAYTPPVVVQSEPPLYAQPDQLQADASWNYCPSAGAYYPQVDHCTESWMKVPPHP